MRGPKEPIFRPTVAVVPQPWAAPQVYVPRADPTLALRPYERRRAWQLPEELVELPEDFVIRECRDLDFQDDAALDAFRLDWGSLMPLYTRPPRAALFEPAIHPSLPRFEDLGDMVDALKSLKQITGGYLIDEAPGVAPVEAWRTIERIYARHLRTLIDHHLLNAAGKSVLPAWSSWREPPTDEVSAWRRFGHMVNAALTPYRMTVQVSGVALEPDPVRQCLYEAAVLQLMTLTSEGRPVLQCGNERCHNLFTRQRSTRRQYKGTEHATGIKYCSRECAKAQSERARRARARAASKEGTR